MGEKTQPEPAITALCLARLKNGTIRKVYPIGDMPISIGRDASNTVPLNDDRVSRHHAVITLCNGRPAVVDRNSSNGTHVNERPVKSRLLVPGDAVRIGWTYFLVLTPGMPLKREAAEGDCLLVARSGGAIERVPLSAPVLIGRAEAADIRFTEACVPDFQASIAGTSKGARLVDLNVLPPRCMTLPPGAELRFGSVILMFCPQAVEAPPATIMAAAPVSTPSAATPGAAGGPAVAPPPVAAAAAATPSATAPAATPPSPPTGPPRPPTIPIILSNGQSAPVNSRDAADDNRTRLEMSYQLNIRCSTNSLMGHLRREAERVERMDREEGIDSTFHLPEDSVPLGGQNGPGTWMLTSVKGPRSGLTVSVGVDRVLIGSDRRCNVVIDHPTVASQHASLRRSGDEIVVADLNSPGGIYVNNQRCRHRKLKAGDTLRIGETEFLVHL